MLYSIWQLSRLSLTHDARRPGTHAIRFGLAVTLYIVVCYSNAFPWSTAAGLPLFQAQLTITTFFLSATAIFGFSQTITEEKEDETIGLIRLADISSLSIILGKAIGLLCDAALLIVIQFPFTIIAITLGGVSWPQVIAAYIALAAYLWMLAGIGIATSVLQPSGGTASRMTAIIVAAYVLPPHLAKAAVLGWQTLIQVYHPISLPLRLQDITESGFNETPWCWPVGFGFAVGLVCLLVSWWSFDGVALVEPVTRLKVQSARRVSRRVWSMPIIWREYVFLTGGVRGTLLRIGTQLAILVAMALIFSRDPFWIGFVLIWSALCSGVFALLDGTWTASRLFRDEVRNRTWSALVQTPHSLTQLAIEKCCGWALGLAPTIISPFALIVATIIFHPSVREWQRQLELVIGAMTIGISVFGYLHLLVLLSLYFGWKATPMTLTVCFAAGWMYVIAVFSLRFSLDPTVVFVLTSFLICGLMVIFQVLILRRLTQLAATA